MKGRAIGLRPLFLAGCILLSLPGLAGAGFYAVKAWGGWQAAQTAAWGSSAAGYVMGAATKLMVERRRTQDAGVAADPALEALAQAISASDDDLVRSEDALSRLGLMASSIRQARSTLPFTREQAAGEIQRRGDLRPVLQQYTHLVGEIENDVSEAERKVTLANPAIGIVIGLARRASDLREMAGRRAILLNNWIGGHDLTPNQKDEMIAVTGRLNESLAWLVRNVRSSGLSSATVDQVCALSDAFSLEKEPRYHEFLRSALAGDTRPVDYSTFRTWSTAAVDALSPLRELLLTEALAQGDAAMSASRRDLTGAAGTALVSLGLMILAGLTLLRQLVDPARAMTATMTALAAGNLDGAPPTRSRLREISAMAAAVDIFRDNIANLRERETELQQTNNQFSAALNHMSQGLAMYDASQRLTVVNRRYSEILRLPAERVAVGMSYQELLALAVECGHFRGRTAEQVHLEQIARVERQDAGVYLNVVSNQHAIAMRSTVLSDGGWVATYEDVTERRSAEAQIAYMAHHDALTGLPNRILFHDRLEQALSRVRRGEPVALLCLNLDGFKGVNDTHGHPVGDELLQAVAQRLRDSTRDTDFVARLGGDEFAIIQSMANDSSDAGLLADRLVEVMRQPFDLQQHDIEVGASVGVVLAERSTTADELLRNADIALDRAKADGRNTWRFFENGMNEELQRRRRLEIDLRIALAHGQFEIHYQPLVKARTQELTGFEALMRWRHPERGLIPPGEFIPVAEEIGLIKAMGAWVLKRACMDAAEWPPHVKVAVNLSPIQFQDTQLIDEVLGALFDSEIAPSRLELEITESVLLQDSDATAEMLDRLHLLGVRVSMDDFGTGYSSLSYLQRFPFDKIKIDQSFVRSMEREKGSVEIIRAVVGLGKALDMEVLAEGVETAEQLAILCAEGCDELQGYLFSKPRPVQDLRDYIDSHTSKPVYPLRDLHLSFSHSA